MPMVLCLVTHQAAESTWERGKRLALRMMAGRGYQIEPGEPIPYGCIPVDGPALLKPRRPPPEYETDLEQLAGINDELLNAVYNTARSPHEAKEMVRGLRDSLRPGQPEPTLSEEQQATNSYLDHLGAVREHDPRAVEIHEPACKYDPLSGEGGVYDPRSNR